MRIRRCKCENARQLLALICQGLRRGRTYSSKLPLQCLSAPPAHRAAILCVNERRRTARRAANGALVRLCHTCCTGNTGGAFSPVASAAGCSVLRRCAAAVAMLVLHCILLTAPKKAWMAAEITKYFSTLGCACEKRDAIIASGSEHPERPNIHMEQSSLGALRLTSAEGSGAPNAVTECHRPFAYAF